MANGKVGRPKGSSSSQKDIAVPAVIENAATFLSRDSGPGIYLTVSKPYIHKEEKKGVEISEYRFGVVSAPIGHSGIRKFEVPVASINCLRNALGSGGIFREPGMYLCEVDVSQDRVRIWLAEWKEIGEGKWDGMMVLSLPRGSEDPITWFDRVLAEIEAKYGDTKVIPVSTSANSSAESAPVLGGVFAPD